MSSPPKNWILSAAGVDPVALMLFWKYLTNSGNSSGSLFSKKAILYSYISNVGEVEFTRNLPLIKSALGSFLSESHVVRGMGGV